MEILNIKRLLFLLVMFFLFLGESFAQKISLDIKGMDILDVLKMLAQRANLNIVVGKNVSGRVTLFLKDVDVWDAFEIILLSNDLAYDKKGEIINVMTARDYEMLFGRKFADKKDILVMPLKYTKAVDLSRAVTQIKSDVGRVVIDENSNTLIVLDLPEKLKIMEEMIKNLDLPTQTRIFELNYAQVDKVLPKIQELITKNLGSIKIDERTNKLVIVDFPEKIKEIEKIIKAFDEKTPQVLIDAQIVEISPSDKFEMGVDWDYWLEKNFRLTSSLPASGVFNKISIGTATEGKNVTQKGDYKGIIDLLRTIGETKILSSPRIMVLNNQEARILVGKREPYASQTTVTGEGGTITTSETINFVDVGIKLYVTPTINKDNFITMRIRPEVSSTTERYTTAKGEQIPIVSTSEAETSVMVKDGVTIIIGGLRKDENIKTVKKIPFIGEIPFLGAFFRNTRQESKKSDLVILLTPHIISGSESLVDFSEVKPRNGAIVQMKKGEIVTERITTALEPTEKNIQKSIFDYYCYINEKINQTAQKNLPNQEGKVKLSFVLSREGRLVEEPKVESSTEEALIAYAITAIKDASPFIPFPEGLEKEKEKFFIILDYKK